MLDEIIIAKKQDEELPRISGIYGIRNLINNKIYIGSSKNIYNRVKRHKNLLKNNTHDNTYIQRSYNKYGLNNFIFFIIEECDISELLEREDYHIKYNNSLVGNNGYNLKQITKDESGFVYSTVTRERLSNSRKKYAQNNKITHCKHGHLYSEENTYTDKRGGRRCKACAKISVEVRAEKRKEERVVRLAKKTHCKNGHLICEENTYVHPNNLKKTCLLCKRDIGRNYARRNAPKIKRKGGPKRLEKCKYGHGFTEENTSHSNGKGGYKRGCKQCAKDYKKRITEKRRLEDKEIN